jgi:hypothetical protein
LAKISRELEDASKTPSGLRPGAGKDVEGGSGNAVEKAMGNASGDIQGGGNESGNEAINVNVSHRRVIANAASLCRELDKLLSQDDIKQRLATDADYEEFIVALVAAIAFCKRGLCPGWIRGNALFAIWQSGGKKFAIDDTNFASKLTQVLQPLKLLEKLPKQSKFLEKLQNQTDRIINSSDYEALIDSPLLVAWVYQCLRQKPRKDILQTKLNPQSARAEDVCLSNLPHLTQWFTPPWISRFLVEETLTKASGADASFCDPACGAGNILVEALEFLFHKQMTINGQRSIDVLAKIFDQQLFGFDIDPFIIDQAGFALYLAARNLGPVADLPIPKLFHFGYDEFAEQSAIGSLYLGLAEIPDNVMLYQVGMETAVAARSIQRNFSAVATNPPYLGHRLLPKALSTFIKTNYYSARFDIYSAFLIACTRLLKKCGRMGLICQQSFLSIQRYEDLRKELLSLCQIESLVQLGSGAFAAKKGEKVSNAIIIATNTAGSENTGEHYTRCWRLTDAKSKDQAEASGINSIACTSVPLSNIGIIPGSSLAFWCPADLARLFIDCPPLASEATGVVLVNGLFTCDNDRFVKMHWQVEKHELQDYVSYDKGGGQKWYRQTPYKLLWQDNGNNIREFRHSRGQSKSLPGEAFYFQPGITYSYIGTSGFSARLLSPNSVFDIASSSLFSSRIDFYYLLGFLNSSLVRFLLGVLNPTVNFQIGDLRKLPFIEPDNKTMQAVADKAKKAVVLSRELDRLDPLSPDYAKPALLQSQYISNGSLDLKQAHEEHIKLLADLNEREAQIQNEIDKAIFSLYSVSNENQELIQKDFWVTSNAKKNDLSKLPSLQDCLKELISYLNKGSKDSYLALGVDKPDLLLSQAKQILDSPR